MNTGSPVTQGEVSRVHNPQQTVGQGSVHRDDRHFDYVMVDFHHVDDKSVKRLAEMVHNMGKKCVATGVDDEDLYQNAFILGMDAMCGRYAAEQMFTAVHSSSSS